MSPLLPQHPLKRKRLDAGVSQVELERLSSVDRQKLGKIERGGRQVTRFADLRRSVERSTARHAS